MYQKTTLYFFKETTGGSQFLSDITQDFTITYIS